MQEPREMSDDAIRGERDKLDHWAGNGGIDETQTHRRQALDRELQRRNPDKVKVRELIRAYRNLTDPELDLFNNYCESSIGECDACNTVAPLSHGQTSSGEGDFCAWGCE